MKPLFTLAALILSATLAVGQNNLFIPFGQSKSEVRSYLNTRDYITQIVEDTEMQSLRAELDTKKSVEYAFKNGNLYATSVTRNYPDKKIAKDIQKNVLDYMDYISRGALQQNNQDGITAYTVVVDSRVIKLFVQPHSSSTTLTLTSISREFMPEGADQDFMYETELLKKLQKSYISN
ncbi:MAG: hypothetical protein AAFY71_04930 [Bacteroidota bacterium]